MPRVGWVKPESDRRLSDLVSVGVLTRVFPPDLVDEVIAEVGRTEQRHRSLPARVMAYFSIGMALYSEGSYQDVLAQLTTDCRGSRAGRSTTARRASLRSSRPGPAWDRSRWPRCLSGSPGQSAASRRRGVAGRTPSGRD